MPVPTVRHSSASDHKAALGPTAIVVPLKPVKLTAESFGPFGQACDHQLLHLHGSRGHTWHHGRQNMYLTRMYNPLTFYSNAIKP